MTPTVVPESLTPVGLSNREALAERILDLVAFGRISVGERLSEDKFVTALNQNPDEPRTDKGPALREAIAFLVRDGVVNARPQSGTVINPVSLDDAKELVRYRAGVEKIVVEGLASTLQSKYRTDYFDSCLAQLRDLVSDGRDALFVKQDCEFHANLPRLVGQFNATRSIRAWGEKLRVLTAQHHGWLNKDARCDVLAAHEKLHESILTGHPQSAKDAVEQEMHVTLMGLEAMALAS